jgi:DNA-binding transcriptional LysR family regulator
METVGRLPDLAGMSLFVKIVEHGSLTAAGRALGIPKASISRRLADLEKRLGVRLINRSTRRMSLTDAGQAFHDRCQPITAEAEAAELEVLTKTGKATGRIRITSLVGLGQVILMPLLTEFLRRNPSVSIDFEPTDRSVDVIGEGFDVAILTGPLSDSSLLARRLMTHRRILVASPAYLKGAPPLNAPEDLRRHICVVPHPGYDTWSFEGPDHDVSVRVKWRLAVTNVFAVRDAVLAHQGVGQLPPYVISDALKAGRLVRVLAKFPLPLLATHAVYPSSKTQPIAVRLLIDYLAEALTNKTEEIA